MPFGNVETKRMPLGLGDIYIANEFVGNLKGAVTLNYGAEYAYQRPGNMIADVKGERTNENVTLEAEICDLKIAQLRRALGINESVNSDSVTLRKRQEIVLSGTDTTSFSETITAGTLTVSKLDRSTTYVSGSDYSASTAGIWRDSGGNIDSGQVVLAEYNFSDAGASSVKIGGELTTPNTFNVKFTHELSDGKLYQIEFYNAMVNTDFSIAFNEKSSGTYTLHNITFKALVDTTKAEGNQLFRITEEDGQ